MQLEQKKKKHNKHYLNNSEEMSCQKEGNMFFNPYDNPTAKSGSLQRLFTLKFCSSFHVESFSSPFVRCRRVFSLSSSFLLRKGRKQKGRQQRRRPGSNARRASTHRFSCERRKGVTYKEPLRHEY